MVPTKLLASIKVRVSLYKLSILCSTGNRRDYILLYEDCFDGGNDRSAIPG